MRKINVINHLTLDGVMQAPGRPDEDTRGDFDAGGWAAAGHDQVMGDFLGKRMAEGGPLLLGRRTYEDFASYWPKQQDNPYTEVLERTEKYVASTTLREPLPWRHSILLDGTPGVADLKRRPGPDVTVMGSGDLIGTLMDERLIDEFVLMIHPVVLGTGRRLFDRSERRIEMDLVDSITTTTGVVIATYRPQGGGSR
ncbi:dihydrofolate reductase family protein [Glycomyces halotolerans]